MRIKKGHGYLIMKRLIIIGLSLCSVLLYGCGSVSNSSQDESLKAEESVVESQTTELFTEENEGNVRISDDVSEDVDNIGLPYDGVYDDNMGFNLDGIDYHFPVTPNDILVCGLYEIDSDSSVLEDDIIEPEGSEKWTVYRPVRMSYKSKYDPYSSEELILLVINRTDAPLKACECEISTIYIDRRSRFDYSQDTSRDECSLKLTNLDGYGFRSGTVSDIMQAYGTPDREHTGFRYYQTAENGVKCTVEFSFRDDGQCRDPEISLNFYEVGE